MLSAFGVTLVSKRVPAFRFIRWKNQGEARVAADEGGGIVEQFLREECVLSDLEADCIYYRDMVERFQQFCLTKGRDPQK